MLKKGFSDAINFFSFDMLLYQNTAPEEEGGQPNHEYLSKQDYKVSYLGDIS